jgi:hypothetical protein
MLIPYTNLAIFSNFYDRSGYALYTNFITGTILFIKDYAKELGIRRYTSTPKTARFVSQSPLSNAVLHMYFLAPQDKALPKHLKQLIQLQGTPFPNIGQASELLPGTWIQKPR